jgi:DNA repair protein RecO (recombination protein O)
MDSFSTDAIVLKRKNFGEADKIVTFFTSKKGKIAAVAKGVRKVTSHRAPNIEILNHTQIFLHSTRGLPILTEAAEIKSFPGLKDNLEKLSLCYLLLELVDQFLEEGQENSEIFNLLLVTLKRMEKAATLEKARVLQSSFQIKFLTSIGYLPQLYNCARCRVELTPENNFLSPHLGGLVDEDCSRSTFSSKNVSDQSIKTLRFLEAKPLRLIEKLTLDKKVIKETAALLNFYTVFFLEKDLSSLAFAEKVDRVLSI